MPAFFLTFLAVALALFPGREAVRVARLVEGGMPWTALLAIIPAVAIIACSIAAWLAGTLGQLVSADLAMWLVAGALLIAALEVALLSRPDAPREPTASLGATAIVLLAGIVTDASGMLVLALALVTGAPFMTAAGGALAVTGVLSFAAIAGSDWEKMPRQSLRWLVALALVVGAGAIGLFAVSAPF